MKAFTYRYLYKIADTDELHVFFKTGSNEEHVDFISAMQDSADIKCALREYVCEYDTDFVAKIEKIKTEEDEPDEKICN